MAAKIPRHKTFISFHEKDKRYRDLLVRMLDDNVVDKSVHDEDIDDANRKTETVRQIIRDDFIADATVTVVLIGPCTWQRKHVDWEIGSSLRATPNNSRCGLLGILLPNHPNYNDDTYDSALIPPRLADNSGSGNNPYAVLYDWPDRNSQAALQIRQWIDQAFKRRKGAAPDNSRPQYKRNRSGPCKDGWQD